MISSSLALILLLVGGQTAVVPDPPGGPGKEYVFPIGDDGPGGGGGGGGEKYNCQGKESCDYRVNGKYVKRWCVKYTIPGQSGIRSYGSNNEFDVDNWINENCKR